MAKVFLDANILFDITERDTKKALQLSGHKTFISTLSYHILFYTYKYKLPQTKVKKHKQTFAMVDFSNKILDLALKGPTKDLEDNIQLHSAHTAKCDYFLTNDKNLLKMRKFNKTKIRRSPQQSLNPR